MIGVVLAGGRSERMGRPKAFIEVDGVPLVRRALDALGAVCSRLILVAAGEAPFASLGVPVVPDAFPLSGPLAGIHAALSSSAGEPCLVVACDQPFLSPALLGLIARKGEAAIREGADAAVPRIGGRLQGLTAAYAPAALPAAEARLRRGELRISDFLGGLRVAEIAEEACRRVDPRLDSFVNLNTPEDLARITQ